MTTTNEVERLLYTTEEAAAALGIGVTKMKQMLSSGTIRSIKIGSLRRITVASLNEYVQIQALKQNEATP